MDFVDEIRSAETTNSVESELVWYDEKLKIIIDRLNNIPKKEKLMILTILIQKLLAYTSITNIERLGITEYVKGVT